MMYHVRVWSEQVCSGSMWSGWMLCGVSGWSGACAILSTNCTVNSVRGV